MPLNGKELRLNVCVNSEWDIHRGIFISNVKIDRSITRNEDEL